MGMLVRLLTCGAGSVQSNNEESFDPADRGVALNESILYKI
jgi:hypothetical protein